MSGENPEVENNIFLKWVIQFALWKMKKIQTGILKLYIYTCLLKYITDVETDPVDSPQLLTDHQPDCNLKQIEQFGFEGKNNKIDCTHGVGRSSYNDRSQVSPLKQIEQFGLREPIKSCDILLPRYYTVLLYIYDLRNAQTYCHYGLGDGEQVLKIRTWISAASSDMSVSLPRSFCSANSNSFRRPVFACMHDEIVMYVFFLLNVAIR